MGFNSTSEEGGKKYQSKYTNKTKNNNPNLWNKYVLNFV